MRTFTGQNENLPERVSRYLRSITLCSILLMLVLIPGVVLPQSAKSDSKPDKITASGEATENTTERHWNIFKQSADDTKRTPGIRRVPGDSGNLLATDSSRAVSQGAAAAESATEPSWKVLLNRGSGINHTSEQPLPWDITVARDAAAGPAPHRVNPTLGGTPPASSVIAQDDCMITLDQRSSEPFGPVGGVGHFKVTVRGSPLCRWMATFVSNSCIANCWVRPGTNGGGNGDFDFEYTVSENFGEARTGSYEIHAGTDAAETYVITQQGVTPPDCTYRVSDPTNPLVPSDGGVGTFMVTTNRSDCPWDVTITTEPPGGTWISASPLMGPGTKTVTYTVRENVPGSAQRSAVITVAGTSFSDSHVRVTQQPGDQLPPNCNYDVSPPSAIIPAQGANNQNFTVSTNPDCPWAPGSDVPWIRVTAPIGNSTGNGMVSYAVDGNLGTSERTGHVNVQSTAHTVVQNGAAPSSNCTFALSPPSAEVRSEGEPKSFTVTTTPACSWIAISKVPWIRTTSNGTGSGTVNYIVDPNSGPSSRTDIITVGEQIHRVTQAGACTLTLVPQKAFVGEISASYGFEVNADCLWTATTEKDWIKINKKSSSSTGKGTVLFTVTENPKGAGDRSGTIKVGDKVYEIVQAAPGSCPERSITKPPPASINVGQIVYGSLSVDDCTPSKLFLRADRYILQVGNHGRRVAINVASSSEALDPKVSLLEQTPQGIVPVKDANGADIFDDDGAAFRNVRIPRLPAKDEFLFLREGTYIVEVTSFSVSQVGNYGLLINPDPADTQSTDCASLRCSDPKILGARTDAKTLFVTGENFKEGADSNNKLLPSILSIDDGEGQGLEKQKTQNEKTRTRTALIALNSAKKVKQVDRGCATLQVKNPGPDGKTSDVFVFGICDPDK